MGKHSQMQRLGLMWPGSVWTQSDISECFLPQTETSKIHLTRYLLEVLQVACLRKIIKPHRKLQWPIKLPVACDQIHLLVRMYYFIKLVHVVQLVFLWQHSG